MCQYMRQKLSVMEKEGFHLDKICLLGTILCLHLNDQHTLQEFEDSFSDFTGMQAEFASQLINGFRERSQQIVDDARQKFVEKLRFPIEIVKMIRELNVDKVDL